MKVFGQQRAHENEKESLRAEIEAAVKLFDPKTATNEMVKSVVWLLLRVCIHLLKREQVASKAE